MQFQFLNNGDKLKVVTSKKNSNLDSSQKIVLSNQTVKNFNTIVDTQDVSGKAVTKKVSVKTKSIGSNIKNSFALKKASLPNNMGVIVSARSNSNNTGKLNIKKKVVCQQISQNIKLR